MTETAGVVANDILLELVVLGADASMDPSEIAVTIRYMNRYMSMIAAQGINLGYTEVVGIGDLITIPSGAIFGMIKNVAIFLSPQFGAVVTPELHKAARDGMEAMENIAIEVLPASLPCTLPIGSGNEWNGYNTDRFFPCADESILTENNQGILVEDDT